MRNCRLTPAECDLSHLFYKYLANYKSSPIHEPNTYTHTGEYATIY